MPLALAGLVIGALIGGLTAWRRKGRLADILQYAAVYAIIFGVAGMILAIAIFRIAG